MLVPRAVLEQAQDRSRAAERTREELFAGVQKRNTVLAGESHLIREEDLRNRVLIARVRIINVGLGLL